MRLTAKQIEIMDKITAGEGEDWLDLEQLQERLSYGDQCTRQAIQCSIRFLEKKGLVARLELVKRRGRMRRIVAATNLGMHMMGRGLLRAGVSPSPRASGIER